MLRLILKSVCGLNQLFLQSNFETYIWFHQYFHNFIYVTSYYFLPLIIKQLKTSVILTKMFILCL